MHAHSQDLKSGLLNRSACFAARVQYVLVQCQNEPGTLEEGVGSTQRSHSSVSSAYAPRCTKTSLPSATLAISWFRDPDEAACDLYPARICYWLKCPAYFCSSLLLLQPAGHRLVPPSLPQPAPDRSCNRCFALGDRYRLQE